VREPDGATRWTPPERGYGEYAPPTVLEGTGDDEGRSLRASFYLQTLTPTTGQAILRAGEAVAGTRNRVGQGTAILLGTFAGMCATAHAHPEGDLFVEGLLVEAGVRQDRAGRLLRRRRVLDDREAWFLINPTDAAVTETVDLEGFTAARSLLDDAPPEAPEAAGGSITITVEPLGVTCLLLSR